MPLPPACRTSSSARSAACLVRAQSRCHSEATASHGAGSDHALDRDFVGFERRSTGGIGYDRHVPASPERLDRRHGNADLGPQAWNDELFAAGRFHGLDDLSVLPGIDERPVDHFLARKDIGYLWKYPAASIGDHARQDGRNTDNFGCFHRGRRVVGHPGEVVAAHFPATSGSVDVSGRPVPASVSRCYLPFRLTAR